MGNELKTSTWENHERNKARSNYELNYPNNGGISSKEWHSCWVYGPYLFSLPTKGRPTRASNREINQKLLTLLEQPSCLTAFHRNWRTGCSHGFLHTGSQSEDVIGGHVTRTQVFSKVMQEHHNGGGDDQI